MNQETRDKLLFAFNVILFLILLSLSIPVVSQIFSQFFSESSTFMQSEQPIKEFPTITICTPYTSFEYGVDLNISIAMYDTYGLIDEGENTFDWNDDGNYDDIINLEQFYSPIVAGFCYTISKNITYIIETMDDGYNTITLSFNESISYDDLPDVDLFLTSEKNSPGVIHYEWMDGDELHLQFPKVSRISQFKIFN